MKIRHERPMSDLSFQVRAPLGLELATGETVTIANWSLEGFEFPTASDVLPKEATLSIPFQGVDIRFPVRLKRVGKDRFMTFDGLSGRQRETLAVFYRSILSGKMASTEEVITSLDTPVDLVPMEETEEEKSVATEGKTPRSVRAVLTVCFYLCLAVLVIWTLGAGIYSKVSTVSIGNARIEAPLFEHAVGEGGIVDRVAVEVGDRVSAGDVLIHIEMPEREAAMDEVRARIRMLERRLRDAGERENRTARRVSEERAKILAELAQAAVSNGIFLREALREFDSETALEHLDLFNARLAAEREVDLIEGELRLLRRERGQVVAAATALNVMAATDGIVREVTVQTGQFVGRGTMVAVVEATDARIARGWLTQDLGTVVHSGMDVSVTVGTAEGDVMLDGVVSSVEAGIDRGLSPEFGLLVSVEFPTISAEESRKHLPHLMPVELLAQRGWAKRLSSKVRGLFERSGG